MMKKLVIGFWVGVFLLGAINVACAIVETTSIPSVTIALKNADGSPAANTGPSLMKYVVKVYRISSLPAPAEMRLVATAFTDSSGIVRFGPGSTIRLSSGNYVATGANHIDTTGLSQTEITALLSDLLHGGGGFPYVGFSLGSANVSFTIRHSSGRLIKIDSD